MNRRIVAIVVVLIVLLMGGLFGCGLFTADTTTTSTTTISTTTTTTEPPATWSDIQPAGEPPAPRCYQAMVYDSTSAKLLMFGGSGNAGSFTETWAYDPMGNTWSNLNPAGEEQPSGGGQIPAAYEPISKKVIAFDGTSWGYDPAANAWGALEPEGQKIKPGRLGSCMAYDPSSSKVYLFGGTDMATWFDETWVYDPAGNSWTKLEPAGEVPVGRSDAGMAYDPTSRKLILFGGIDANFVCLNDTWAFDPATGVWTKLAQVGDVPAARSAHAMAYDPHSKTIVIFGGIDSSFVCYDDTWAYDPAENAWTDLLPAGAIPAARGRMMMVYADKVDKLIMFGGAALQADATGGFGGQVYFNDTWSFGVQLAGSAPVGSPATQPTSLTSTTLGTQDTGTTLP